MQNCTTVSYGFLTACAIIVIAARCKLSALTVQCVALVELSTFCVEPSLSDSFVLQTDVVHQGLVQIALVHVSMRFIILSSVSIVASWSSVSASSLSVPASYPISFMVIVLGGSSSRAPSPLSISDSDLCHEL
jgi:hypothetical protein